MSKRKERDFENYDFNPLLRQRDNPEYTGTSTSNMAEPYGLPGGGPYSHAFLQKKARAIAAKINKKYPYKQFGRAYLQRGTAENIARFGETYKTATAEQKNLRKQLGYSGRGRYRGRGAYFSPNEHIAGGLRAAGGLLGGAIGSRFGMAGAGASLGTTLAGYGSKYLGFGAYENQIAGGGNDMTIQVNPMGPEGDVIMSHTEYLGNVTVSGTANTSSTFQFTKYALNPGISTSFPFLSQIAQNFKLYEFQGLMFQYKPNSGEGSANQLGKVVLCTQYDPTAPDYTNTMEMQNYDYAQSSKPSSGMVHGVETKNSQQVTNMSYIRTGASTRDKALTDVGTFYVATEGIPMGSSTNLILGELWVSYRVKLSRASLAAQLGATIPSSYFTFQATQAKMVNTTPVGLASNGIDAQLTNVSATEMQVKLPIAISNGTYQITITIVADAGNLTTQYFANTTTFVNCVGVTPGAAGTNTGITQYPYIPVGTTANTWMSCDQYITVNAPDRSQASVNIKLSSALPTGTYSCRAIVQQINPNLIASS